MLLRLAIALMFSGALVASGLFLYSSNPDAGKSAFVAALLGALAALLFPRPSRADARTPTQADSRASRAGADSEGWGRSGDGGGGGGGEPAARGDAGGDVPASALLEATMESIREGVLVVDRGGRVVASNNAARAIFGEGEATSKGTRRLSELTRDPAVHSAFGAALERGERAEVKVETGGLERRVFDLQVAPLKARAGAARSSEARGAVGVFFDITRLERLERVRQEFLSNVSHELRTPLTAILTFVETLEEGAIDDPAHNRRFLAVIRRNSERMHNLINDILELSAIEAGTVEVEPTEVRLSALVNECLTALDARAAERHVRLLNEVAAEVFVHADARRLEQMLTNLLDNAIKFTAEGGEVRVAHERVGERDRVHVTDTGEGIAPEHVERIFERFYRIDRARSRALGGTGLGLAIVKHLARAHGGEATVRSAPGHGSTFTVELPARAEA
ncbi:MAG: PAS domain-containing protein [Acidobacteria bacterium]|nr:PAS domain-containing protein [Acidobacteriota bacterium]